ncbi:CCN family member 1-like isoform X2 [Dunckerocampus dactyliophorus]|uniref:CCN family member 1-like isoform X2 n=1 Tax=Dunckerocampus dactyliophorus TaxID=161453 RepID=UPI00240727FD|nr:CCN family member 1-like isoform X2 [Dunckerocampus dactyliophorus]XP_054634900.1 CCN family member 1-like isoform X2 [Dunckerocampus dactyliophorus]
MKATSAHVTASCPAVCECPAESSICPPGISAVPDGCGCCKVCAAQLNQDCSPMKPCDHHKGLECNYGNDVTVAWGVCRAKSEGRTCEYSGRIYQNGESFRVRCKHQCTCIDGAVGCAPLCDYKMPPASPSCPFPQLVRMPGQCCFTVNCHKGTWGLPPKHHKQMPFPKRHQSKLERHPALRPHENEPLVKNDIAPLQTNGWEGERGYNHLPVWDPQKKCPILTTDWSQCSRSCGMGISSRLSNKNPQCRLERETRLCTVRPCSVMTFPSKSQRGKRCSTTQKAPTPLRLSFGECVSVRLYRPNSCNVCSDGRCCSPHRTRTVAVTFACPDGQRFQRSTMFIQSCKCSVEDCGLLNDVALPPQHWMYGDTHKFID